MPQMAPMNWTIMFTVFIALYLLSMIMVYFHTSTSNDTPNNTTDYLNFDMNWKW